MRNGVATPTSATTCPRKTTSHCANSVMQTPGMGLGWVGSGIDGRFYRRRKKVTLLAERFLGLGVSILATPSRAGQMPTCH